jgi:hypothetical protein
MVSDLVVGEWEGGFRLAIETWEVLANGGERSGMRFAAVG